MRPPQYSYTAIALHTAQTKCGSIAVTSTASTSGALPDKGDCLRIVNEGPNNAYISVGSGSQTATVPAAVASAVATCTPILAGTDITLQIDDSAVLNISAICRSGATATLLVSVSNGA